MSRRVAIVGLLVMVVCAGAGWLAIRPPLARFIVPGATDIQVAALGWDEWQISYHSCSGAKPRHGDTHDVI
jgi:hypothetical protein